MTPLQKAAAALIEQHLPTYLDQNVAGLRKALDAEIAQTVEPVADDIVAGALYDFLGYLTSRRTRITMSDRDDAGAAADALVDWSKTRKINLAEARVVDWNDYTHPPQPQATTAVLRECWYESNELKVCRKCGQLHDKAIAAQGEKP